MAAPRERVKSKILLLYPPTAHQKMLPFPPLGLAVLAGHLRRLGLEVAVADLEIAYWERDAVRWPALRPFFRQLPLSYNNPKKAFLDTAAVSAHLEGTRRQPQIARVVAEWIQLLRPQLSQLTHIGLSVMSAHQLGPSLCLAQQLKRQLGVTVIIGGSFISRRTRVLLERYPFVDYLVLGEGEVALGRLLQGEPPASIENLCYREGEALRTTPVKSRYAANMEPDFSGFSLQLYRRYGQLLLPYETSKGCKNACAFCITRKKRFQVKEVQTVVESLVTLSRRHDTRCFFFVDNAINVDRDFSVALCEQLIRERADLLWSAYFLAEEESPDYFRLLREAGCIQLRWGIETIGSRSQAKMRKRVERPVVERMLRSSAEAGIWNHLLFMIGYPGERLADALPTAAFLRRNKDSFKSALVSPFDLERIDLQRSPRASFGDPGLLARYAERRPFGIPSWKMKDHLFWPKYALLRATLQRNGVRFLSNFSRSKDDFERDQFMYRVFADAVSAAD